MADELQITGTEQFVKLARALNAQGSAGKGLKRELMAGIRTAAKPMEQAVRAHVGQYLPSGYAGIVARELVVRPSQSVRGNSVGLKLVGYAPGRRRRRAIGVMDRGTLRHPVFGDTRVWVDQPVRPGFWSEPMDESRDKPAVAIRRAIQKSLSKI